MSELELRLLALREEIDFPPTPKLADAVERTVALSSSRRRRNLRPLALALAVVLVATLGVLALSPGARSAFLELFHLRGATVSRVDELPEVELVERADLLGVRVTRAAAQRQVGFRLADLGEPDEVYLRGDGLVTFVYGSIERPRLLLSQVRGRVWDGFVKKLGGRGSTVQEVDVEGERGLFVSGEPHFVMYLDAALRVQEDRAYLAGTTLLWNRGEVLLRLEADVELDDALELAGAVE